MAWLSDLAGKAEHFLNNLDEQTGAALRQHRVVRPHKFERYNPQAARRSPPKTVSKRLSVESAVFQPRQQSMSSHVSQKTYPTHLTNGREHVNSKDVYHHKQYVNNYTILRDASCNMSDSKHQRRMSLPSDLELIGPEKKPHKLENLETENAVLRNELHMIAHDVKELIEKLRMTEDGNDVDSSSQDFKHAKTRLQMKEHVDKDSENEYLFNQIKELKQLIGKVISGETSKHKKAYVHLVEENKSLHIQIKAVDDEIQNLNQKLIDKEKAHTKLENELRHSHSLIDNLQNDVDRTKKECKRLEEDWETYKMRVKGMLHAKDTEIKGLRDGLDINEDCKVLSKQVDSLKEERQELHDMIERVHKENSDMKRYVEQIESKNSGIDRTVTALRDALKEEHAAKAQVENQYRILQSEFQSIQFETDRTIASLRTALRDKDVEINNLRTASIRTSDTSNLNVADYTQDHQESIDNEKLSYLTQMLCQKQERIDALLADNNMMKIQMDNLESKLSKMSTNSRVINVQEIESRARSRTNVSETPITRFLLRIGIMMKRYPIVRLFIVFYMVGLHFCVISILLANTPDTFNNNPSKS